MPAMSSANLPCRKWSMIGFTLAALMALNAPGRAQDTAQSAAVHDWSHHHIVFSTPSKERDAMKSGHYSEWLKIVNDPRYTMQQRKRDSPIMRPTLVAPLHHLPAPAAARGENEAPGEGGELGSRFGDPFPHRISTRHRRRISSSIDKDWSMNDGANAMAANAFPAKYSLSTTTASCNDYIVYPTGAGSTNATMIAYKNVYAGTCSGTVPTVAWAYNTGGTSRLSPVLSLNGSQVAYIQTSGAVASLVILKPSLTSGGTVAAPINPSLASTATYRSCTAPCYTTITLSGSPNDTNSSPFFVYGGADTLYVGDDSGKLHKFTGVFSGTPAEASAGGWPVTASTQASPILTSPVYDSGTSKLVFVGDGSGYLHSVTTTGASSQTVLTSNHLVCGTAGLVDAPIVDSTTENVYVFVGDGCDATPGNSYINRFAAGTSINASYGANYVSLANAGTNSTSTVLRSGAFDNAYYSGAGNTGNLYACVNGALYRIPMSTFSGTGTVTASRYNTMVNTVSSAATCSPVTEFYNGTQDWLFMSVTANGNATGCTGACLYNFNVQGAGTTGTVTDGLSAAGGTSGIIIDNSLSGPGESQIYYTTLANQACTGNGTTGTGTGNCAIQASQSAP
jgi:hypothetical protein